MNIDFVRQHCASLPAVTEDVKWGNDLCFSVGGKMFCVTSLEEEFRTSFKVRDEEFDELSARQGFQPAPYMARARWVLVDSSARINKNEWQHFLRQSYDLVRNKLTKKTQNELGLL